ncbi:MAG: hypothetical protein MZV70_02500 [Desulfobacterales bacterium]|nr:hypothetical protein [Desulfobacterales bacterium]
MVIDSIQTMFSRRARLGARQRQPGARGDRAADAHWPSARASRPSWSATSPRTARSPGRKLLEHMVDTVLYFEGDRNHIFRVLRAVKNRFGSTNEIGVFEMKDKGLDEVANPSAVFLSERPAAAAGIGGGGQHGGDPADPGGAAGAHQRHQPSAPRGAPSWGWTPTGWRCWRRSWRRRSACTCMGYDIFMNVAGGVKVVEPAVDLGDRGGASPRASSTSPCPTRTVVMGEVGLTGEVRAIGQAEQPHRSRRARWASPAASCPTATSSGCARVEGIDVAGVRIGLRGRRSALLTDV